MKALVVGAGPVGRVMGWHLRQGGADVAFLVKPAHVGALEAGFSLVGFLCGRERRYERPRLVTAPEPADLVIVATGAPALAELALDLAPVVALMQPVLDDLPRFARGVFAMMAEGGGAADPAPTRVLRPPLGRLPFSGPGAATVADALARGGLPTRVVDDVRPSLAAAGVVLDPLAAAIAIDGRLADLARDAALLDLVARASWECAEAAREFGVRARPIPAAGAAAAIVARAPFGIGAYLERHYGKLRAQTAAAIDGWIARARSSDALRLLRERLDAAPAPYALAPRSLARLARRQPIAVNEAAIAIKRNVQEFEVGCDSARFAEAFAAVMADPSRRYGPIVVKRPLERVGKPFVAGDRFTGCFTLASGRPSGPVRWIEDAFASDYAEVTSVSDDAVEYRYLHGSPIAGKSTLRILPIDGTRCRFQATFEYQEIGTIAIAVLQLFGHRQHDRVLAAQVAQAAALANTKVVASTFRG